MQFVNITSRCVFTSFSGNLRPGQVSADGGPKRKILENALTEIVDICGNSLGIRLNTHEADLLRRLMDLDEKGGGFDRSRLPAAVRDDPTGEKRNAEAIRAAQQRAIDKQSGENAAKRRREAEINGEIAERAPVGPATLKGEPVTPEKLKSPFERIMDENARIASGQKVPVAEVLDPIGAHMQKDGAPEAPVEPAEVDPVTGSAAPEPVTVSLARNAEGDGTRSADAVEPVPQAPERGSEMDRQAADVAEGLATMGPVKKGRGRGRKAK